MKKYDMLNKHKLTLLSSSLVVFTTLFFSGCWKSEPKEIASKLIVINVLDKDYYDDCHITGSTNIPFEDLEGRLKSMNQKDQYVIYCSNYACTAAPFSAKTMKEAGFEQVSVYHGGMVQWFRMKYPCTGSAQMSYLQEENDKMDDDDNDEPLSDDDHSAIVDLTAKELKEKMTEAGLLS